MFKSKVMDTEEKFSYTFTKAGTYSYYCSVHPEDDGQGRGAVTQRHTLDGMQRRL